MIWNFLGSHVGEGLLALLIGAIIILRFRRYRAVAGAIVGVFSSAATVTAGVIGVLVLLVAAGYWDPPIGKMLGDVLGAAEAAWDLAGEWVVSTIVDALKGVAE